MKWIYAACSKAQIRSEMNIAHLRQVPIILRMELPEYEADTQQILNISVSGLARGKFRKGHQVTGKRTQLRRADSFNGDTRASSRRLDEHRKPSSSSRRLREQWWRQWSVTILRASIDNFGGQTFAEIPEA